MASKSAAFKFMDCLLHKMWLQERDQMTHDELLAMINPMTNNDAIFMKDALRAVIKLHPPQEITLPDGSWGHGCECGLWPYPCPTIQAIEKELE
jgi:hypothetical protein